MKTNFEILYRTAIYLIYMSIIYLIISFFWLDIMWFKNHTLFRIGFIGLGIILLVPTIIVGAWTPSGFNKPMNEN